MLNGGLRVTGNKTFNQSKPIITVITVVYNGESTLQKTIDSVISQSYENIEYIIVDGGSKDGTVKIIEQNTDKIDYWQSKPDKGIYDAMNKAIELSTGEWINFLNCGDIFVNQNVIQSVYESDFNYDVLYGSVILRWQFGDELCESGSNESNVMPFCHQSCFTRTSLLKEEKFDLKFRICADRNFYKQINRKHKVTYKRVSFPISIFDCTDSVSINNDYQGKREFMEIEEYKFIKKLPIYLKIFVKSCFKKLFPALIEKIRVRKIKKSLSKIN